MNYLRVIEKIFQQYQGPKFSVQLWDSRERFYGSGESANFKLIIKDAVTVQRLLSQGSLGFGESFMDGSLDVKGNIEAYLRLRHNFKKVHFSLLLGFAKFWASFTAPRDRKNQIAYHYDLGNEFFSMILDSKTMSYSAGLYKKTSESLADIQRNKIDFVCKWLNLPENASVLDLASGWGNFAIAAAKNYKWQVTGYTLSEAQLNYCRELIKTKHLEELISIQYHDMLLNFPSTKFDGVIMIESIEHIGQKNLTTFFGKIKSTLKKGAPLILQLTGRYIPKRVDRWTLKYVFPGGYLPAKEELLEAAEEAGFLVEEFRDDTPDYIGTMSEWIKNLEGHQNDIEKMFDKRFYRLWYLWMHGAKVNFELGEMSLFRIKLRSSK